MSKIPEPARQELLQRLSRLYAHAKVRLDGELVSFEIRQEKALKYCLVPFINGFFRPGWSYDIANHEPLPDEELARRVMRRRIRRLYSGAKLKQYNKIRKLLGKPPLSKEENEFVYWDTWHCPKALLRHLEKEFKSIEIVERDHASA